MKLQNAQWRKSEAKLVYLVRHGETDANRDNLYQGQKLDLGLNAEGIKQAYALGRFLKTHAPDIKIIYTSPTLRTMETAIILAHSLEKIGWVDGEGVAYPLVIVERGLYEIDVGDWCEKTQKDVERLWPGAAHEWYYGNPNIVKFPDGESVRKFRKRVREEMKKILAKSIGEKKIIVVGHGGVNSSWIASILKIQFRSVKQANTCLNVIERSGDKFKIILRNSAAHLL